MHAAADRLVETATAPLAGDPGLRDAAAAELRRAIAESSGRRGDPLEVAAATLAEADGRRHWGWWRMALVGAMVLLSLPLLAHSLWQFRRLSGISRLFTYHASPHLQVSNLTPHEQLVLLGDPAAATEAARWKPLWDSDPQNPAYLARYAAAHIQETGSLPADVLEAAARIDPGNAWFEALDAAGRAKGAIRRENRGMVRQPAAGAPVWIVEDRAKLDAALAAVHRVATAPRFASHRAGLAAEQLVLLPPRKDFASQMPGLVWNASQVSPAVHLRQLIDALAAGAQETAAAGDVAGFRRIAADWRAIAEKLARDSSSVLESLVARVALTAPLPNLRDGAEKLGLAAEAAAFGACHERLLAEKAARDKRFSPAMEALERRGATFAALSLPMLARQVSEDPPLSAGALRPGRYADHALLRRGFAWFAWAVLGLCAAAAAGSHFLRKPWAAGLSGRLQRLFRPADWAVVLAGGVLFPLAWFFAVDSIPALSVREWAPRASGVIAPAGQFTCLLLAVLVLSAQQVSARLARRGAVLGLAPRWPWPGWLAATAALAGIPAFGLVMTTGMTLPLALAGMAALWPPVAAVLNLAGRPRHALRRATQARLVWPVWVAGMLAMAALVPFFHARERHWLQQDRLLQLSETGLTRYESTISEILRNELLESIRRAPAFPGG